MEKKDLAVLETLDLCKSYGIACAETSQTAQGWTSFPAVAKPNSAGHKSESGLVFLGLKDEAELTQAVEKIGKELAIIQEQVFGTELILGAKSDPAFGKVVMVGLGGTFSEIARDVAFLVAPFTEKEAIQAISALKSTKLLEGFRGKPKVNILVLAETLVTLGKLAVEENVEELDLNPAIATKDGKIIAVDGRAVVLS